MRALLLLGVMQVLVLVLVLVALVLVLVAFVLVLVLVLVCKFGRATPCQCSKKGNKISSSSSSSLPPLLSCPPAAWNNSPLSCRRCVFLCECV